MNNEIYTNNHLYWMDVRHKKYSTLFITDNDNIQVDFHYHDIPRCLMLYHGQFFLARQPTV